MNVLRAVGRRGNPYEIRSWVGWVKAGDYVAWGKIPLKRRQMIFRSEDRKELEAVALAWLDVWDLV